MPQMAPLNWLSLMSMFIVIMLMFNSINYFSFNYPLPSKKFKQISKTKTNWKW